MLSSLILHLSSFLLFLALPMPQLDKFIFHGVMYGGLSACAFLVRRDLVRD